MRADLDCPAASYIQALPGFVLYLFLAMACTYVGFGLPKARAAGMQSCSSATNCTYTCDFAPDDTTNINTLIGNISAAGGGILNIGSGKCLANSPITFSVAGNPAQNVWLKGSGSGPNGTLFVRNQLLMKTDIITVRDSQNIQLSNFTIDPGNLFVLFKSSQYYAAGSSNISFPLSTLPAGISLSSPTGDYLQTGIFDFSAVGCQPTTPGVAITTPTNAVHYNCSPAQSPALQLDANGNISDITVQSGTVNVSLDSPSTHFQPGAVNANDTMALYLGGGGIDIEAPSNYKTNSNVNVNNVTFKNGSKLALQGINNYVVSNSDFEIYDPASSVLTQKSAQAATYFCLGGLFVGRNFQTNYGIIVNNKFNFTSAEVDSGNTVFSGNRVLSGATVNQAAGTVKIFNACGGVNSSLGQYQTYQGNAVSIDPSFPPSSYTDGSVIPFNHDNLPNVGIQITSQNALIAGNNVFDYGVSGIESAGSNNVVICNETYNDGGNPYYDVGRANQSGAGIVIEGSGPVTQNSYVEMNCSANAPCQVQNCPVNSSGAAASSAVAGLSQSYAMDLNIGSTNGQGNAGGVNNTNITSDNNFIVGSSNGNQTSFGTIQSGAIYNEPGSYQNPDGSAVQGSINYSNQMPKGQISATTCPTGSTSCSTTITWSSANAGNAVVYVSNSNNPSNYQIFASGSSGSQVASWIQNAIYVFKLVSDQGLAISSTTVLPGTYSH